jgi:hypothetical protein
MSPYPHVGRHMLIPSVHIASHVLVRDEGGDGFEHGAASGVVPVTVTVGHVANRLREACVDLALEPACELRIDPWRAELKDHPKNGWSLLGLQHALEGKGDSTTT